VTPIIAIAFSGVQASLLRMRAASAQRFAISRFAGEDEVHAFAAEKLRIMAGC